MDWNKYLIKFSWDCLFRVIIVRYRVNSPKSGRTRINNTRPDRDWALWGPKNRLTFCWCPSAFHSTAMLHVYTFMLKLGSVMKSTFEFSIIDMPLTQEHVMQWINATASRERRLDYSIYHLCQFKRLLHKKTSVWFKLNLQEMTTNIGGGQKRNGFLGNIFDITYVYSWLYISSIF